MYEVFVDDNKKIIESGNVLFANLKLSGENHAYIILIKKVVKDTLMRGKCSKSLDENTNKWCKALSPFGMRKHPIDGFEKCIENRFGCTDGHTNNGIRRWGYKKSRMVWWRRKLCCYQT